MQSIALRLRQNLGESERKKCLEPNKTLNRVIKTKDTLVFLIFFYLYLAMLLGGS